MSDLVKRLKEVGGPNNVPGHYRGIAHEAATEIEQLQARLDKARKGIQSEARAGYNSMGEPFRHRTMPILKAAPKPVVEGQEPDIHIGRYHHPDCNYWQWDWRYSWAPTDCNCEDVAGPIETTLGGMPITGTVAEIPLPEQKILRELECDVLPAVKAELPEELAPEKQCPDHYVGLDQHCPTCGHQFNMDPASDTHGPVSQRR